MKEIFAYLGDHFFFFTRCEFRKNKKPSFEANFFKMLSLEHCKKNEWKVRVCKPFKKV
jgi:hypothetical protein